MLCLFVVLFVIIGCILLVKAGGSGSAGSSSTYDPGYVDFEIKYEDQLQKKADAIQDAADRDFADPEKKLENYQKVYAMLEEFKAYCNSLGSYGVRYYKENFGHMEGQLAEDERNYRNGEYLEEIEEREEEKRVKKKAAHFKKKIFASISANDYTLQTDLKDIVVNDSEYDGERNWYNLAIDELLQDNKIERFKIGNKVAFRVMQ